LVADCARTKAGNVNDVPPTSNKNRRRFMHTVSSAAA
jgi:hypothetical protein